MRSLVNTFWHADLAARMVGFEYISGLTPCVSCKNDEEDWQREAATIAAVYSCFGLNSAAIAASDRTKGCFHLRTPDMIRGLMHLRRLFFVDFSCKARGRYGEVG